MIQEPLCGHRGKSIVLDSRQSGTFKNAIRRRRQCRTCGKRFSTIEFIIGADGEIEHSSVVSAEEFEKVNATLKLAQQRILGALRVLAGEDK